MTTTMTVINKNPKDIGVVADSPTAPMTGFPLTELGNAERLVHLFGDNLRFCTALGWLVWDGKRWKIDNNNEQVSRWYAYAVRDIALQADEMKRNATADPMDERGKIAAVYAEWAKKSEANGKRTATLEWAQRLSKVPVGIGELDKHRFLLNVQNGTLDLRTGMLKPHDRADLITRIAPVTYDPNATCPTWDAAMARWQPLEEVRAFLQRAFGYSLTGVTGEHTLFFLYGEGRNGKSIFTGRLENILGYSGDGGYAARIDFTALSSDKRRGGVTPELVNLVGARCVIASEPDASQRWSESTIKDLTGGDRITVNPKHRDAYEFLPEFKLWVYGNHKISIASLDKGIEARLPLIPFEVFIPEAERDQKLAEKLDAEAAGILAWAVRGCMEWQEKRLSPPASVVAATEEYHNENDPFAGFWEECCVFGETAYATPADIYNAYAKFASIDRENRRFPAPQRFGEQLRKRGASSGTERDGGVKVRVWRGVGIKTGFEPAQSKPEPSSQAQKREQMTLTDASRNSGTDGTDETNSPTTRTRVNPILAPSVPSVPKETKEENKGDVLIKPGIVWDREKLSKGDKVPDWKCSYPAGTGVPGIGRTQIDALDDALGTPDQEPDELASFAAERLRVEREGEPLNPDEWLASFKRKEAS